MPQNQRFVTNEFSFPPLVIPGFCIFCPHGCLIPGEHHHNPKHPDRIMLAKHEDAVITFE